MFPKKYCLKSRSIEKQTSPGIAKTKGFANLLKAILRQEGGFHKERLVFVNFVLLRLVMIIYGFFCQDDT